jgi:hypothetical protein
LSLLKKDSKKDEFKKTIFTVITTIVAVAKNRNVLLNKTIGKQIIIVGIRVTK